MSLRVYNSLSKQKEPFQPVQPGKVGMYLCGPTVYKSPHIGHMVGPVIFDAIKRYLQFRGFEVNWVVNITDVEDKLIDASNRTGQSVQALAEKYTAEYRRCLDELGVDGINHFPKASEHIGEITDICQKLIGKGHAYAVDGSVYFDVVSNADYGKLSHRKVEEQSAGTRDVEAMGKKNAADFALWKAAKPGEPAWDSPWGKGRPGWHIECSAMSMKILGETFDFHGGGLDLLFPHHENEIAQSECCTGKPFAKYWMHNGLTRMKTKAASGEWKTDKIAGSEITAGRQEGSAVDAKALIEQHGADPLRYLLLSTHYRSPIDFTADVIASSKKGLAVFPRLFERVERILGQKLAEDAADMEKAPQAIREGELGKSALAYQARYVEMMDDDFNTAGAIAVMHELAGAINAFIEQNQVERDKRAEDVQAVSAATGTLRKLAHILGLFRREPAKPQGQETQTLDQVMGLLIAMRAEARKDKNFGLADRIRKGLGELGITLEDRADGTIWRKA